VLGGAFNPVKTSTANLYEVDQTSPGSWNVVTTHMLDQIDLGTESIPAFGDIDGDGDLDLVIGTKIEPSNPRTGGLYWFENVGSRTAPSLQLRGHLSVLPPFHEAPALGDLHGDGLPDLVIGDFRTPAWYRNSGVRPRAIRTRRLGAGAVAARQQRRARALRRRSGRRSRSVHWRRVGAHRVFQKRWVDARPPFYARQ
jgi:hypothetical protein